MSNPLNPNDVPSWDLTDLYQGLEDEKLEADLSSIVADAVAFEEEYKGQIAQPNLTAGLLVEAIQAYEQLLINQYRLQAFAQLTFTTDTTQPERGALLQRTREVSSQALTYMIFFDLELGQISNATFDQIIGDSRLAAYLYYLQYQRNLAKHRLSEEEEKIIEETANSGGRAFVRLFTEVTSQIVYPVDGEDLTQSQLLSRFQDPDREKRQMAAKVLSEKLQENAHVLTYIFNTLLHEKQVIDRLRDYKHPESSRHLSNDVDQSVVDTMVDVAVNNLDIVSNYYQLKQRLLGIEELTHYDRYAPILDTQTQFTFTEAQEIIMQAFADFSPELAELTEPFFSRRWIDAEAKAGKQGGAYCMGVEPELHPYVFMNYNGSIRDVMTLAHELGHGVHDMFASQQTLLNYHPALPLCETASTFGEMLVFDKLQQTLTSAKDHLALLCRKTEDTFATVFRQIAMFRFEREAHQLRRKKGEQTLEAYGGLWQKTQQEMFGGALTLGDEHQCWWLYIPHVYRTPFYVYAYAFGELLVLSLYAQYRKEGATFIPRYFDLLRAGGSDSPKNLVSAIGFDISDPDFWQSGCDLIRRRVDLAIELAGGIDS